MSIQPRFIVADVETFGLDPEKDPILEVGFAITDLDFGLIDTFQILVWDMAFYGSRLERMRLAAVGDDTQAMLYRMHTDNGLIDDARARGMRPLEAERQINQWLHSHGVNSATAEPMVGSSVQFDRSMLAAQFPSVAARFSYRNIDASSFKEMCMRVNPRMFEQMAADTQQQKKHRVKPDIEDSIAELKWYVDNFLFVDPQVYESLSTDARP